jgi:acyl-CoA synthetase (AMP-forming)/AMP-acid ligase II
MQGLMMDFPLTLGTIFRRAETLSPDREIVSRRPDKALDRYTYGAFAQRTRRLIRLFQALGVRPGDRIATLCWSHSQHLETYFAAPLSGAVLHTLNLRLHPDELAYVINHAEDRVLVVDASLAPLFAKVRANVRVPTVMIVGEQDVLSDVIDYEAAIAATAPVADLPELEERAAAVMCYTSGTTGRAKGVVYSHRSLVLHSFGICLPDVLCIGECEVVLPAVPMFHANAWGFPFACAMVGAKLVLPGSHLDPLSILELLDSERVTIAGGVPTIWMAVLQALEKCQKKYDLSALRFALVGGSAPPASLVRALDRYGIRVLHAWGMTETSPLGTISRIPPSMAHLSEDDQYAYRCMQGRPVPFVDIRARNEDGLVPWDGKTVGELEVRGPWVAGQYYRDEYRECFTSDGWFRTGDIVTIDPHGTIAIQDRLKDVVKSGGEWISSVALENALMGHPAVAEAAVVAIAHPKWCERPLAAVVVKNGASASPEELRAFLASQFPKFWLPDAFEFVDAIPRTATGKFLKSALRERFKGYWTAV